VRTIEVREEPRGVAEEGSVAMPRAVASTKVRRSSRLRRVALLFVYAWAVYTLIEGGGVLTSEQYARTLQTAPRAAQGGAGDGYAQALIKLERTLPYGQRVVVVWRRPDKGELGFWYSYFWSTYWLYPRRVDVVTDPGAIAPGFGILLDVRSTSEPELPPPAGYTVVSTYQYPDLLVTVLEAPHA
jgi:hypothetical protein